MKKYLKILFITTVIQIIGFGISDIVDSILIEYDKSTVLPIMFILVSIILSTALGIILPMKWYNSSKEKLVAIFLLPTNYTLITYLILTLKFIGILIDIFKNYPDNLG